MEQAKVFVGLDLGFDAARQLEVDRVDQMPPIGSGGLGQWRRAVVLG